MLNQTIIEALIKKAISQDVKLEILYTYARSTSVRVFEAKVDSVKQTEDAMVGLRVITRDFSEGCAYSERFDLEILMQLLDEAIENARICKPIHPIDLFEPKPLTKFQNFYHPHLDLVQLSQMTELALKLEDLARKQDERIINIPYVIIGLGSGGKRLIHAQGLDLEDKSNHCSIYLGVTAESNGIKKTGGAFDIQEDFSALEIERVAKEAVENATSLLNPKPLSTAGVYPIILSPDTFADLIDCFSDLFNAKMVLEGKSLLKGKLNTHIASNGFTLLDDPSLPHGYNSMNFDAEGVEANEIVLIENGVLKNYLHNSATASQMGAKTNGRAARSAKSALGIASTNWVVKCENNVTLCALRATQPSMIEVVEMQGLHAGVNPVSGDFSVMADGFWVEKGERKFSLQPFTIAGNILTLLQEVIAMSSDDRKQVSNGIETGSVYIQSLAVSGS